MLYQFQRFAVCVLTVKTYQIVPDVTNVGRNSGIEKSTFMLQ